MRKWITLVAALALIRAGGAWAAYTPQPSPVVGGGTGLATLTAHGVMVGAGTANVVMVGPGSTAGVPLISAGSSVDPAYGVALPVGGGTGLATLTAHAVMVGEATANIAMIGPGATAGVPLVSGGASADPSFTTAVVAGGGTGLATIAANSVLVGAGTSNIHTAGTSATADSVLGWGAAAADPAPMAVGDCQGSGKAVTYTVSSHAWGCNTITAGAAPTVAIAGSTASITLASTNLLTTIVNNTTVTTATLPSAVTVGTGFRECLKDGTEDFAAHNVTLKSTAGTIDGVAAATGIVLNQTHMEFCAISDGSNWYLE